MKRDRITIGVFLGILGVLSLGTLLGPREHISELENRVLADAPELSADSLFGGAFMEDTDTWLADHVLGKNAMIFLKTGVERLEGRTLLQGVYYRNGRYLQHYGAAAEADVDPQIEEWNGWARAAKEAGGIPVYVMPVPLDSTIQSEDLPAWPAMEEQDLVLDRIFAGLTDAVGVDCWPVLREHREEPVYFGTDHHWTMQGAYYAAAAFLEAAGQEPIPLESYEKTVLSRDFYGTLYSKAPSLTAEKDELAVFRLPGQTCEVVIEETGTVYEDWLVPEKREEKDQYAVFFGGNYAKLVVTNTEEEAPEGRLLVIKDSYANCLVPYLLSYYGEITMIDPRYDIRDIEELIRSGEYDAVLIIQEV